MGGYPLIKQAINQGYEVIEFINGNTDLDPADEPLITETLKDIKDFDIETILKELRLSLPISEDLNPLVEPEKLVQSSVTAPFDRTI